MALNIKDPEALNLARQQAEQTGETITRAVTEALHERLARYAQDTRNARTPALQYIGLTS